MLQLADLVANRTMSPDIAALLDVAASERRSFLVVAIPRLAGKSTVMGAMLDCAPPGTPTHELRWHPRDVDALSGQRPEGYLVVPEISPYPVMPGYIWGPEVRRVFALLDEGYALATALHAGGVAEAFAEICAGNDVPDDHAAHLQLVVYLRSLGRWDHPTRRVVAEVHEILGVRDGVPDARLLHRWDETNDRFEAVAATVQIGTPGAIEAATIRYREALNR